METIYTFFFFLLKKKIHMFVRVFIYICVYQRHIYGIMYCNIQLEYMERRVYTPAAPCLAHSVEPNETIPIVYLKRKQRLVSVLLE